ncbi:YciI family protein [Actinomadura darangshiensis]|uniref:YciI family protein n=1 Tax=Actinomadura darangshiensis TaxID=705336 RepID=UPI001FB83846|nr:YciI family protein [Actinomadura darangshiensis]
MKLYALNMIQPVGDPPPPEVLGPVMAELAKIRRDLEREECWVFGRGLHGPEASTVVKVRDDDVIATDGPWAEGKEHIGGVTIIKVEDLDAALKVAARFARATGLQIEVRPFQGEV